MIEDINLHTVYDLIGHFATYLNCTEDAYRHVKENVTWQYEQAGTNLQRITSMINNSGGDKERLKKRVYNAAEGSAYIPAEIRDQLMRSSGLLSVNQGIFPYKDLVCIPCL